jgi:hypothetical protein
VNITLLPNGLALLGLSLAANDLTSNLCLRLGLHLS